MEGRPVRVLLVEDDEDDYFLIRELLSEIKGSSFQLDRVDNYDAALETITATRHDVYLLDYRLGPKTGLELLNAALKRGCTAPIIMLTGQGEREVDIEAMQAGAADYLMKGAIDASLLDRSIRYAIEHRRHSETLQRAHDELERRVRERTAALEQANAALRAEIAERQRAEEALYQQREWLRVTLTSIGDAVIVTDAAGDVTFLNPVAQSLVGWTQDEAAGKSLNVVFNTINEHTRQREDSLQKVVEQTTAVGLTSHTVLVARDGSERSIDDCAAPIRDEHGNIVGVVLIFRDVTQRRQAEKDLKDADRRKDEFLAMLAHELRNPMAALRHGLHILRMPNVDSSMIERAQNVMKQQVRNLTRLVDDLLDVSRITRGKIDLQREPIDLVPVIQHAVETVRPLVELQSHELSVSLPRQRIPLEADPTRLEQVFTNLLSNAAKYTEPGGRISLTVDRNGTEVVVSVQDNGIGISKELLPRVFDMFTQEERTLDRSQGGLGIGLTLVRQLVELHGGNVLANSDGVGKGSQFIVRLPASSPRATPKPAEPSLAKQPAENAPLRVLVVEDEFAAAEMLVMLLRLWGHSAMGVHDGPAALTAVQSFRPEVILCDIGLPGINGYQLARQLRQQEVGQKSVLVAITGYGQEEDRRRARSAGFDHHLTKPVDPMALNTLLADCASVLAARKPDLERRSFAIESGSRAGSTPAP